jgi:cation:H+ antiporter
MHFLLLAAGFAFLIKGADFFVNGASSLGLKLKIPQILIGLTVVALGTSLPELFVNIVASIAKKNEIALGNIAGSNIFNILMILGVSAMIYPITAGKSTVLREIPFVILVAAVLFVLSNDALFGEGYSIISRGDGVILLVLMGFFVFYLYRLSKKSETENVSVQEMSAIKIAVFVCLGIAGLIAGGNLVVYSATGIARFFGLSDKIIAVTVISIGTGLPELVTSVVASLKKNSSIALGNIVGSNIINIALVLGLSALISPIEYSMEKYLFDYCILIASSLILLVTMLIVKRSTITRIEGLGMVMLYGVYIGYAILMR